MAVDARRDLIVEALATGNGILRLAPAWVARDFLPPGKRLGLPEHAYDLGEHGPICERWLGSTTRANNKLGPPDEGLSYLSVEGPYKITLRESVASSALGVAAASGPPKPVIA
jgi:hypothetical protein